MSCESAKKPANQKAEIDHLRQKSVELAIKSPEKAVAILSAWIHEASGVAVSRPSRKKTG